MFLLTELMIVLVFTLGLSIVTELIFALVCRVWNRQDWLLVGLVNVVTTPWVAFGCIIACDFDLENVVLAPLEIAAVVVEALFYKRYSPSIKYPWLLALGANCFSLGVFYCLITFL